jgi:catechol 2,3-dioxygenase
MGVGSRDIFGMAGGEPATAGSYGDPPRGFRLPSETGLGPVRLQVADLERSLAFYREVLGLRVLERADARAVLAAQDSPGTLVELSERRGARPAGSGLLGLYHFAILLPERPSLGRLVRHLSSAGVRPGAADHRVSEALYLSDPDGLGIEVYADRPRSSWQRVGRELMLATDPLAVEDLVRSAGDTPWLGMPAGTRIGHVHLHVGDLDQATSFFAEALGFDRITWSYPGALFLGAGGYHHHVGTNTWAGSGARRPGGDDARLLEWTIEVPDHGTITALASSLAHAGHPVERPSDGELVTHDPWGTAVRVRAVSGH